ISFTFLNPFSHQSNLMVMKPGGYSATMFVRFGIPLTIASVTAAVIVGWALLVPCSAEGIAARCTRGPAIVFTTIDCINYGYDVRAPCLCGGAPRRTAPAPRRQRRGLVRNPAGPGRRWGGYPAGGWHVRLRAMMSGRREDVLAMLRTADAPLSIAAVADELSIHPNTARFHLDALLRTGQVESVETGRIKPGRPPLMFRAVPGMDPAGPRDYRMLAGIL